MYRDERYELMWRFIYFIYIFQVIDFGNPFIDVEL